MKLKIKQNILMKHLNYVIKGISSKNLIPILNCIKFVLTDDGLYLMSTDNEIAIKTFISKNKIEEIEKLGSIVESGRYIYDIVRKLPNELINIEEVVDKMNQIKIFMNRHYNKVFKSFSTDNGSEFSDFLNIIKDTKAKIYFCHPYRSGEKGTNEKQNSMIRYFIPKGTLIENYSFEDINNIATWMNNYPRKSLDYKTPLEAVLEEFNDKSIINKIYKLQETVNSI